MFVKYVSIISRIIGSKIFRKVILIGLHETVGLFMRQSLGRTSTIFLHSAPLRESWLKDKLSSKVY